MLLNNINSIPQIVLLRNDKVLLQLVNTIIHNKSLKKGFNELFEGIRDYYPNRYRLEEIEFAIKQKEFESSKINSINYNFNFMEHLFNNFFKYDGSNIYVKDEIIEEYSKTITKVSPLQIIGYKLSKDLNEANLSINDLILYINNYTPLGFKVEKSVKYAENHLHLKGSSYVSFNMSKLFNYKTPKKFFKKKFLKEIPRINEFSLINNNNISIGHIIDLTKLSIEYIYNSIFDENLNSKKYISNLQKIIHSNYSQNIDYQYSISQISKFNNEIYINENNDKKTIIKNIVYFYKKNEYAKAHLLEYALFFYTFYTCSNPNTQLFIKIYLHSVNILRSYMVMSQNLGLSHFSEFSGSTLRNRERRNAQNISANIISSGTSYLNAKLDVKQSSNKIAEVLLDFKNAFENDKNTLNFNFGLSSKKYREKDTLRFLDSYKPIYYKKRIEAKNEALALDKFLRDIQYKKIDKFKSELKYKNIEAYKNKDQLKNIHIDLSSYVVSIDAVGKETHTPPEVFAPFFKYVRLQPQKLINNIFNDLKTFNHHQKLLITAHAGEDFNHIITGMRRIEESIKFFEMDRRDRLGHVLSLGIFPKQWLNGVQEILIEKGDLLDDLVWLTIKLKKLSSKELEIDRLISIYMDRALKLFREIYPICEYKNIYLTDIYEAWTYRKNCPLAYYKTKQIETLFDKYSKTVVSNMNNKTACEIYELYQTNVQVRKKSREIVKIDKKDILNEEVKIWEALQDYMIDEIGEKGIIIETNPSSNIFTSSLDTYNYHPIFRFYPPKKELYEKGNIFNKYNQRNGKVAVTINSDDPAIFVTTLQNEYRVIKNVAIEQFNCTDKEAEDWIEDIRKFGIKIFKESYIESN